MIERIRSKKTFDSFRTSRFRAKAGPVRIAFVDGADRACLAFAINRKVGGAVVRNRLRRRLRSICSELEDGLSPGAYLIGVSREAVDLSYGELKTHVEAALRRLRREQQ